MGHRFVSSVGRWLAALACVALLFACGGGGGTATTPSGTAITAQPADQAVIEGAAAHFSVTAINVASYQWQRNAGAGWTDIAGATGPSLDISTTTMAMSQEQFRVVVGGASGNVISSAARLQVSAAAVAAAIVVQPVGQTVIEGQDAVFSVTATGTSLSYVWQSSSDGSTWTDIGAPSAPTLLLPAVSISDSGRGLRVQVANQLGSVTSAAATLGVGPAPRAPVITAQPTHATVVAPLAASFSVAAAGSPVPDIRWQTSTDGHSWQDVPGATQTSLTLSSTAVSDSGRQFRAVATNASGEAPSAAALLTVNAQLVAPSFVSQPQNGVVVIGEDITFAVGVQGAPTPVLQWQVSTDGTAWSNITGATDAVYALRPAAYADNGNRYRVVATNSAGTLTSATAQLTVTPVAPTLTSQPQNQTVVAPAAASFSVTATGLPAPAYQWQQSADGGANWTDIAGATASAYTLPATDTIRDNGLRLRAVVSNAAGRVTSSAAQLAVRADRICSAANHGGWCWAHPSPQGNVLHGVAHATPRLQVAVGDKGTIIRSADAGVNWVASASGSSLTLNGIAFASPTAGVVVGAAGTLLRTVDAGATWGPLSSGTASHLLGVAFSGSTGVAVGAGGTVLRTTDGGQSWAPVASGTTHDLAGIAFASANVAVAVGAQGTVLRSVDGGQNWGPATVPFASSLTGVAFSSTGVGLAVGDSTIWRSVDGGQTWVVSTSGAPSVPSLHGVAFQDANHAYAVGGAAILGTSDGGQTWGQLLHYPPDQLTVKAVAFGDVRNGALVGAGGLVISVRDGTWSTNAAITFESLVGVAYADPATVVAVGPTSSLLRSTDAGQTWARVNHPANGPLDAVAFASRTTGIAVGYQTILRTTDAGSSWSSVGGIFADLHGAAFANASIGLAVGAREAIVRTADGGLTWTSVNTGLLSSQSQLRAVAFAGTTTAVAVGEQTVNILGPVSLMFRSADGGQTWGSVSSGTTEPLYGVAFANATTGVAVGNAGAIVRTTDGGSTWAPVASGVTERLHAVSFVSPTVGFAVGARGTLLRTADAGQSWASVGSPTGNWLHAVAGSGPTSVIVVGTGGGILVTTTGSF